MTPEVDRSSTRRRPQEMSQCGPGFSAATGVRLLILADIIIQRAVAKSSSNAGLIVFTEVITEIDKKSCIGPDGVSGA